MNFWDISIPSILIILSTLFNYFFLFGKKYIEKRAENFAVKKDIGQIEDIIQSTQKKYNKDLEVFKTDLTDKVEGIKNEYRKEMESFKKDLTKEIDRSRIIFEMKTEIYKKMYNIIVKILSNFSVLKKDYNVLISDNKKITDNICHNSTELVDYYYENEGVFHKKFNDVFGKIHIEINALFLKDSLFYLPLDNFKKYCSVLVELQKALFLEE